MLRRALPRLAVFSAIAAAGGAVALAITATPAHAYNWTDLPSLGYSVTAARLANNCNWVTASGYGQSAVLGNSCDSDFQSRVDAFVNATCPCAQTTTTVMTTTTAASPATTTATTTTAAAATTSTTTTPPTTDAVATTQTTTATVAAPTSTPPFADFTAAAVNPSVVAFSDTSTSGTAAITSRVWQFGDGTAATGASVTHAFPGPGAYEVALIIVDTSGLTSIAVHELSIASDSSITLGPRTTAAVAPHATPPASKKHSPSTYPNWVWFTVPWAQSILRRDGIHLSGKRTRNKVTRARCSGIWTVGTRAKLVDPARGIYITEFKEARCRLAIAGGAILVGNFFKTPAGGFVVLQLRQLNGGAPA